MNNQKPSPRLKEGLQVHSIFPTLQGEGPTAGQRAIFIRLAGCNLQCPFCDTEYSKIDEKYSTESGVLSEVYELAIEMKGFPLIVITGGEPFRQPICKLITMLLDEGYKVQIETNGTMKPSFDISMFLSRNLSLVISPKTNIVKEELLPFVQAFKYVLDANSVDKEDGLPSRVLGLRAPYKYKVYRPRWNFEKRRIYIQPEDTRDQLHNYANTQAAVESCMKFGYTLSLQQHKILGLP